MAFGKLPKKVGKLPIVPDLPDNRPHFLDLDLDFQKISLSQSGPVLMQKIRTIGPTVGAGGAVKHIQKKNIRKQY